MAWLGVAGILVLFTLALTWISVIAGLSAKTVEGAGAFSYPIVFLPFISSAFVLTSTMPGPVRAFAGHQPVTSIVNTIRDLFTRQPVSTEHLDRPRMVLRHPHRRLHPRRGHLPPQDLPVVEDWVMNVCERRATAGVAARRCESACAGRHGDRFARRRAT